MEKIIITEEAFAGMRDYVPLREKLRFLDEAADGCFDRMELKIAVGADSLPMPPLYKENAGLKARMLMGAFVRLYVGAEFEADERCPWLMSEAEYDRWAGSHVMNQIRRFKKKDGALRDKAYDLLADWAELEQRFGYEVRAMLEVMNEPVSRMMMAAQQQTTPEVLQNLKNEMERAQKELEAYAAQRGGAAAV